MTQYNVVISPEARRLMGNCVLFLAEKNREAAIALKDRLVDEIRKLDHLPERFPFFNEQYISASKYRKMLVEEYYLILYQIRDDAAYVDYIVDCRQDYQWLLR